MDVTPLIPVGRQVIDAYGDGGFRISGRRWEGSLLVTPSRTLSWGVTVVEAASFGDFAALFAEGADPVELLLIGSGRFMAPPPRDLRIALKAKGVAVEPMDTGAACRTYNVLLAEDRRVAAAVIAVN